MKHKLNPPTKECLENEARVNRFRDEKWKRLRKENLQLAANLLIEGRRHRILGVRSMCICHVPLEKGGL